MALMVLAAPSTCKDIITTSSLTDASLSSRDWM